jgi:hypothetical protein
MAISIDMITQDLGIPLWLFITAVIWTLLWKGLALWKSAKKGHLIWFIVILLVNTLGLVEILYVYLFSEIELEKDKNTKKSKSKKRRR